MTDISEIEAIAEIDLPVLTAKQQAFVGHKLAGKASITAYKMAYQPSAKAKKETLWVRACEVASNRKVTVWLDAGRKAQLANMAEYSLQAHMSELDEALIAAKAAGNHGAVINAIKAKGQAMGHGIESRLDVHVTHEAPLAIIERLAEIGFPQLALAEARARGIAYKPKAKEPGKIIDHAA
jgi:hypothetical protein